MVRNFLVRLAAVILLAIVPLALNAETITVTPSGGGGSFSTICAASSSGEILYNNAGVCSGDTSLFWDNTHKMLGVGTATPFADNNSFLGSIFRNDNAGLTLVSAANATTTDGSGAGFNVKIGAGTGANFTIEAVFSGGAPVAVLALDTPAPNWSMMAFAAPSFTFENQAQTISWATIGSTGIATLTGGVTVPTGNGFGWSGQSSIGSGGDGIITLYNNAGASFSRLQFGGTTSSFPSIKRNATAINFRLADDSADAPVTTGALTVSSAFTATGLVTLADHATQATNTVVGNATAGTASPTALAVGTCSTASSALIWTTNTGFGCNTSITAASIPVTGITGLGTGVATALAVNVGTAGSFVVNGGALGSPSSAGTLPAHTLGGTVSGGGNQINNVIIGTTTPLAGSFTTVAASTSATVTSASAVALAVGLAGATNPAFVVNSSTASQAAGFKITGAATGGTVALAAIDSGADTNITVDGKGAGTVKIATVSTGNITIGKANNTIFIPSGDGSLSNLGTNWVTLNADSAGFGTGGSFQLRGSTYGGTDAFSVYWNGTPYLVTDKTGETKILSTTASTSTITGALRSAGGLGVVGAIFGGSTIYSSSASVMLGSKTTITGGATGNTPTLTAGPVTGNPTKWLPYDDNGTTRYIPAW